METGSKIDKLVIGARGLKNHLGRYLIQGLVASVFLHSAIMALVEMWPNEKQVVERISYDTTNVVLPPIHRPDSPETSTPQRPVQKPDPDTKKYVPTIDEPVVLDTVKETEEFPQLVGKVDPNAPIDSGDTGGSIAGTIDTTSEIAGTVDPWRIFIPREIDPVALTDINPQPEYPEMAQKAGVGGTVNVWLHVSEKGGVIGWQIVNVRPAGLGFEDAVARVVPKWKFTPAIQQNNPVAVWVHVPIKFRVSN